MSVPRFLAPLLAAVVCFHCLPSQFIRSVLYFSILFHLFAQKQNINILFFFFCLAFGLPELWANNQQMNREKNSYFIICISEWNWNKNEVTRDSDAKRTFKLHATKTHGWNIFRSTNDFKQFEYIFLFQSIWFIQFVFVPEPEREHAQKWQEIKVSNAPKMK